VRLRRALERVVERLRIDDVVHRQREPLADAQVRLRVALELRAIADDEDRWDDAAILEMARYRQAIAAVLSRAAENRGAFAVAVVLEDRVGHGERGVFHQDKGRDGEALRGALVDGLHLLGGEDLHDGRGSRFEVRSKNDEETLLTSSFAPRTSNLIFFTPQT